MSTYYLLNLLAFVGFIGGAGVAVSAWRNAADAWHYGLAIIAAIVCVASFIRIVTVTPF